MPEIVVTILGVITKYVSTLATTLQDDTRLLENGGLSLDVILAVQFRRSRKALLGQLAIEVEQTLDADAKVGIGQSDVAELGADMSLNLLLLDERVLPGPLGNRVRAFNNWVRSMGWPTLHIEAAVLASHGGRIGTIVTKSLYQGEVYIDLPETSKFLCALK